MTTGSHDPAAAGRDRLRAGHADREQAIETLKNAFVDGRLTRDELDARAGQALAARTCAELTALIADIPASPAPAGPLCPPAPVRRRPLARAVAKSGICLIIATAAIGVAWVVDPDSPGRHPYQSWAAPMAALAFCAIWTAVGIMTYAVFTLWDQKLPRSQLPPRPGAGGHAIDAARRGGTGHRLVPPGQAETQGCESFSRA